MINTDNNIKTRTVLVILGLIALVNAAVLLFPRYKNMDLFHTARVQRMERTQDSLLNRVRVLSLENDSLGGVVTKELQQLKTYKYKVNEIYKQFDAARKISVIAAPSDRSRAVTEWIRGE